MSRTKVQLALSSADVKASSKAAAEKSGGRIILVPVDFSDHSAAAHLLFCATDGAHGRG